MDIWTQAALSWEWLFHQKFAGPIRLSGLAHPGEPTLLRIYEFVYCRGAVGWTWYFLKSAGPRNCFPIILQCLLWLWCRLSSRTLMCLEVWLWEGDWIMGMLCLSVESSTSEFRAECAIRRGPAGRWVGVWPERVYFPPQLLLLCLLLGGHDRSNFSSALPFCPSCLGASCYGLNHPKRWAKTNFIL